MIHNISWANYCYAIVLLFTLYYIIIAVYYYKSEIGQVLSGKHPLLSLPKKQPPSGNDLPAHTQSLIDELRAFCEQSAKDSHIKAELIDSLKILLGKYEGIKNSKYVGPVNTVIRGELEKRCSIYLSDAELDLLWKG